jgi:hypothetical protein
MATRRYRPAAQKHIVTKFRRRGITAIAEFRNIDTVMILTRRLPLVLAFAAALAAASGSALAQRRDSDDSRMSPAARERLREQVDSARRDAYRRPREERGRERLTPAQRERLRRDIQDANRDLERRRR